MLSRHRSVTATTLPAGSIQHARLLSRVRVGTPATNVANSFERQQWLACLAATWSGWQCPCHISVIAALPVAGRIVPQVYRPPAGVLGAAARTALGGEAGLHERDFGNVWRDLERGFRPLDDFLHGPTRCGLA